MRKKTHRNTKQNEKKKQKKTKSKHTQEAREQHSLNEDRQTLHPS